MAADTEVVSPDGRGARGPSEVTGADFSNKNEAQAERLIHSVNAVTELLRANTDLRD